ncbi:MAG: hypothetical protein WD009_11785 [Phycisphaeraceae bacterium]
MAWSRAKVGVRRDAGSGHDDAADGALAGHDAEQFTHRPHAHLLSLVALELDELPAAGVTQHRVNAVVAGRPIDQIDAIASPAVGLGHELLKLSPAQVRPPGRPTGPSCCRRAARRSGCDG